MGWMSTNCNGQSVISRLAAVVDALDSATEAMVLADPGLAARMIVTVAQLRFAVERAVGWCLDHDADHLVDVPPDPPFILPEADHLDFVEKAHDAVSGTPATHDWGLCLDELEHGGDGGDTDVGDGVVIADVASVVRTMGPIGVQLSLDSSLFEDAVRAERALEFIRGLGRRPPRTNLGT